MDQNSAELAKLICPKGPDVQPPERLFEQLDELRQHSIVWIGGCPGAGKATLIASYLENRRIPAIWYHVESEDPWETLLERLRLAASGSAPEAEESPSAPRPDARANPVGCGRQILRNLYRRLPQPGVLVLNDCHDVASDGLLHSLLVDCAREIPRGINVFLIGRGEPPGVYTRLIATRTLGTLDGRELQFTPIETRAIASGVSIDAPHELQDLANRAGAIVEECGDLDASVALRLQTRDWESILRMIFRHGMRLLARGHTQTVRKWIAAFPVNVASESPWLSYWSGAAAISENPSGARYLLGKAWASFEESADGVGQLLTAAAMLETYQFEWSSYEPAGRWIERLETCRASFPTYPTDETELRVLANLLIAQTWLWPALELSASCIARLRELLVGDLDVNHRLFAARSLLVVLCLRRDVKSVKALTVQMRSMLCEKDCSAAIRASALNAIAYGLWLEGAFAEAECALQEAMPATGLSKDPLHHLSRQRLASSRRDRTAMVECIQCLRQSMDPTCHIGMSMLSYLLAEQSIQRGEPSVAVSHWFSAVSRADEACARPMRWISRLALAGCLATQGDCSRATQVLQDATALIKGDTSEMLLRDYELVAAYVALRSADGSECHRLLGNTLPSLADAPAASTVFALFPDAMAEVCVEALRFGIAVESVRGLIQHHRLSPPANADCEWPWPFKVFVLGRFRVLKGDAPIRRSRRTQRKPLELLQALIAFGGTEVGAGVLTDALWPDSEGDAAYHALESALYRLRQLLGAPSAVTMTGGKLSLDPTQIWVDMWALEGELQTMGTRGTKDAGLVARLRQLYVGHFLEQESEKPWALKRRQSLRDRFVRAVREIARTYESQRLWQQAATVYQAGLDFDSLAEDFHRGLMVCHRELGDHAEALQAYRRCRELLIRVLGVQPNAKTLAIYQSVRQSAVGQAG